METTKSMRLIIILGLLIVLFNSCKEDDDQSTIPDPTPDPEVILPKTTKILDSLSKINLLSVDSIEIVFSQTTPFIETIAVGDVIASGITSKTPHGLLRKVLEKKSDGGRIVFQTRQAKLTEAIEKGSLHFSTTLSIQDTVKGGRLSADAFTINLFEKPVANNLVKISGKIEIQPKLDFDIDLEGSKLKEFTYKIETEVKGDLTTVIGVSSKELINDSINIANYNIRPINVMFGPLPIVLLPELNFRIGIKGSVSSNLKSSIAVQNKVIYGYQFINGNWVPIKEFTQEYTSIPLRLPKTEAEVKIYAGARLDIDLYARAIFNANADLNLFARAKINDKKQWWIYGGVESNIGIQSSLFDNAFIDLKRNTLFEEEVLILGGKGLNIIPDSLQGAAQKEYTFTASFPDSKPQYPRYIWDFGDGTPSITIDKDSTIKHTFTKSGNYKIEASIVDIDGKETIGETSTMAFIKDTVVSTIKIIPSEIMVEIDSSITLKSVAFNADGDTLFIEDDRWQWSIEAPEIASVMTDNETATVKGLTTGNTNIIVKDIITNISAVANVEVIAARPRLQITRPRGQRLDELRAPSGTISLYNSEGMHLGDYNRYSLLPSPRCQRQPSINIKSTISSNLFFEYDGFKDVACPPTEVEITFIYEASEDYVTYRFGTLSYQDFYNIAEKVKGAGKYFILIRDKKK